jgi:hypothetical protein
MQPRLKSSTKWTNLPLDVATQIKTVFEQNFQKELGKARVIVEGRLYPQEILLRVGHVEPGRLVQNNFEISMDYEAQSESSALNTIHLLVDVAASLLTEHFESEGELEIPNIWTEFPFDDHKVWLQHTTENSSLEKQANELLGEWDDSLVQESEDDEAEDSEFDDAESDVDDDSDPEDNDSDPMGSGTLH